MDIKRLSRVELKADGPGRGQVSAVFSTFNVIDADGDVTLPGAFTDGAEVPISSYGHSSWQSGVPVGKGKIRTTDTEAILDGQFFMDTQAGKDTFTAIKELGSLGQWSYGYDVLDAEPGVQNGVDVRLLKALLTHEVSPVLVGVGVNTRTLSAKSAGGGGSTAGGQTSFKTGIRAHKSGVTNREWDRVSVVAAIAPDASVSDLRSVFALVDAARDPEAKSSYQLPHHHGVGGPANVRAVIYGIADLNGAAGATMTEAARKAAYEHLAAHLRDADREAPVLRPLGGGQPALHEQAIGVLAGISDYLESVKRVAALRAQAGKQLSQINLEALGWVGEELQHLAGEHASLMRQPREAAQQELLRHIARQHGRAL